MNSVSRASSPLLFGLAPRGVCRAPNVAIRAVGSYPTFSPLPINDHVKMSRRFSFEISPGTSTGGLFSVALSVTRTHGVHIPWRYQARSPSFKPAKHGLADSNYFFVEAKWCPDFPPASAFRLQPAIIQLTRRHDYNSEKHRKSRHARRPSHPRNTLTARFDLPS